jgi:hypothetical protein
MNIVNLSSKLIFRTENNGIFYYDQNTGDYLEVPVKVGNRTFNVIGNLAFIYNPLTKQIDSFDSDFVPHSSIKLPEGIEIIDAVIGNKRVFFYDRSNIYISTVE